MVSTVTAYSDMAPQPRVDIFVDPFDLNGSTSTVTIHQISAVGDVKVRDGIRRAVAGGLPVTDYEVPPGIPVTYRFEQFAADGSELGYVLSLEPDIVVIPDGYAVLSDPLNPKHAILVDAHDSFGSQLVRSRPVRTINAGGNTIALMGLKGLYENIPLRVNTRTHEDADMLDTILSDTQMLVRLMPSGGRLPVAFHCIIPSPAQLPIDVQWGGEWAAWDLTGVQVSRSEIDILVPVITYARFAAFFATYAAAASAYSTYLDALLNPPPEV